MNMTSKLSFPHVFVLHGHEKKLLFTLEKPRKNKWKYNYHYDWARGDVRAQHDISYIYGLPYEIGKTFRVSQSCNGTFTHHGKSQFAIDFSMPVNTPVVAARDGLVVGVKQDSNIHGATKAYSDDANYVLIEHSDGTLGEYFHLRQNGVMVDLGQYVGKGEVIAYSGNTGFSRGPHLHFAVQSTKDGKNRISHPTQFFTHLGLIICPEKNTYLLAQ